MPAPRRFSPKSLLMAFFAIAAPGAWAGSLIDCLHEALAADPVLQIQRQRNAIGRETLPQARAALLPSVTAAAGLGAERRDPGEEKWQDARSRGLAATQTLLSAQAWQTLRAARLDVRAGEAAFDAARQQLLLRVAESYFRVLSAAEQLRTSRAASAAFGELLRQAQVRQDTGLGTRGAVTQAQSFFDITRQPVIDAANAYEDALRGLAQVTGRFRETVQSLPEEMTLPGVDLASVEEWLARQRAENPGLEAQSLAAEAAHRRLAAERASALPVLLSHASIDRIQQDGLPGGTSGLRQIGLAVSWPLFQGGAQSSRVRAARAGAAQADAEQDLALRVAERELHRAWRAVSSGLTRVQAGERAMESTREAVEAARTNVEFGTGSEFELLQAQNQHFNARRAWQQARLDFLLESLRLELQAGDLTEEDLTRIDALLTGTGEEASDDVP
jgi:outer membrane protein